MGVEVYTSCLWRYLMPITRWMYLSGEWRTDIAGLAVVVMRPESDPERIVVPLRDAVRYLDSRDKYRSRVVRRYLRQVVIWHGDYTAADRFGGAHFDRELLKAAPIAFVASALVHEAVHQRISRRRIAYAPAARERIEALCVREQASFLRQCSETEAFAEVVERGMAEPWWNEQARLASIERNIEHGGLPKWTGCLARWCSR